MIPTITIPATSEATRWVSVNDLRFFVQELEQKPESLSHQLALSELYATCGLTATLPIKRRHILIKEAEDYFRYYLPDLPPFILPEAFAHEGLDCIKREDVQLCIKSCLDAIRFFYKYELSYSQMSQAFMNAMPVEAEELLSETWLDKVGAP